MRKPFLPTRRLVVTTAALAAGSQLTGCWAYLVYGGEENRPRGHTVMWGFVILDILLGFWLFFIPLGLIIDFSTGAIYRPLDLDRAQLPEEDFNDPSWEDVRRRHRKSKRGVRVHTCSEGSPHDDERTAQGLRRWALRMQDHFATCPECSRALVAEGPIVELPDTLRGTPALVDDGIEVVLSPEVVLDYDAVAALLDDEPPL